MTEEIVIKFPNDTYAKIYGDPYVLKQIVQRLDGLVITFEHKTTLGFDSKERQK